MCRWWGGLGGRGKKGRSCGAGGEVMIAFNEQRTMYNGFPVHLRLQKEEQPLFWDSQNYGEHRGSFFGQSEEMRQFLRTVVGSFFGHSVGQSEEMSSSTSQEIRATPRMG